MWKRNKIPCYNKTMIEERNLPIGIQDFEKLRNFDNVYVDKTRLIWDMVKTGTPYFLSRPRRFGKSLLLSTIKAYFLGKKELFKDLAIEKIEEEHAALKNRKPWQVYPIIQFDLNSAKYSEPNALSVILDSKLCEYENLYGITEKAKSLSQRFERLLKTIHEKTGFQSVILVDEYDKPLLEVLDDEAVFEDNRQTLKSFFGVLKSEDAHIRFSFLTGVTKFSQVSVFSDLNNLKDISMDKRFSTLCGISESELTDIFTPEIERLAESKNLTKDECIGKLKSMYDGYHFSQNSEGVYNPFSLLNAFDSQTFESFWFKTGTPSFLVKAMQKADFDVKEMEDGVSVLNEEFSEYRFNYQSIIPLLYQSGYLTIKDYDSSFGTYTLMFPNHEVKYSFLNFLMPLSLNFEKGVTGAFYVKKFIEDLNSCSVDDFMTRIKSLLSAVPYNVYGEKQTVTEQTFQTGVFLIFQLMGQFVQVEIQSAKGRADCVVKTKNAVYIFEFKLKGTAQEALEQIESKDYAIPYSAEKADGKKLIKIGVGFEKEIPVIKEWIVKE